MKLSEQCVWVLGAGFLGSALARAAVTAGARVLSIDPTAVGVDVRGCGYDAAVLREARARLLPAVVFCCMATRGGSAADYARCYLHTVEQLRAVVPQAKLVFCSSTSVYGETQGCRVTEQSPAAAKGERAALLLRAEQAVLAAGGAVARLAALYGEGRCELLRRHAAGEPQLPGAEDRFLNYVHVEDAAAALLLLAHAPAGVYNVCGCTFTKAEAYERLEQQTGVPRSPLSAEASCRGCSHMQVAADKMRALGWVPRPFFE